MEIVSEFASLKNATYFLTVSLDLGSRHNLAAASLVLKYCNLAVSYSLKLKVLSQVHVNVCRIHFLIVVALEPSVPRGHLFIGSA